MQGDLFASNEIPALKIADGDIAYIPNWLAKTECQRLMSVLTDSLSWRQDDIVVFGKRHAIPRLQAWYGDKDYRYSGIALAAQPLTVDLHQLNERMENEFGHQFNVVLANLYRNEKDSVGWHADDEAELGRNPIIASISLGESRLFELQHVHSKEKIKLTLEAGSLLIMKGTTQHFWQHQIPKQSHCCGPRINLTFRYIN